MEYLHESLAAHEPRQATTSLPSNELPHDNLGPQLNFTIWLLTGLSLGFLGLRVYCKFLRGRGLWWDDYVLITSWVCLALASGFTTAATTYGYGKHLWDIPEQNLTPMNVVASFAGTFSILAAVWSKTSFAMTVLRISTGWMRWSIWFIIMSVNVVLCTSAIFQWIRCMPIQKTFDKSVAGECWPAQVVSTYNTFSSAYSGAMDMVLALFPWKIIWAMKMNRKEKLGVLIAMSMGVFAGAASFIKVSKLNSLTNSDPINTVQLVIWGVAESAITIIAASIPILRALLRDDKLANVPPSESEIQLNSARWRATGPTARTSSTGRGRSRATAAPNETPSWVTAPVTVTSANRDGDTDRDSKMDIAELDGSNRISGISRGSRSSSHAGAMATTTTLSRDDDARPQSVGLAIVSKSHIL